MTDESAISAYFNTSGFEILKKDILHHSLVNKEDERILNIDHIRRIVYLTLCSSQGRGSGGILMRLFSVTGEE
jgi:hypothetical protein